VQWHGLLSPQTPGFRKHSPSTNNVGLRDETSDNSKDKVSGDFAVGEYQSEDVFRSANRPGHAHGAGSKDKSSVDVEMTQLNLERDVALARQFEQSSNPTPMRRSTRVRRQPASFYEFTYMLSSLDAY
jgi:hypothetical protein